MRKLLYLAAGGLIAAATYWAVAQTAPQPLVGLFPSGALLYLEAKDLSALLADWNGSAENRAWANSANHAAFSRSRLFLKLGDAQKEFAAAAGVPPDDAMLTAVAGGNSALAIYNIGNLEFLYITHLASGRALNTDLWKARGTYQTRRAGGVDYYLKQDQATHRVAAFAYTGDTLLLATREDVIAGALELIARQARPTMASEKWFADATQAAQPGSNDLRLVYNMDRLLDTPYFRSYWIQRNATAMKEFSSGLTDLERSPGEIRERRVILRAVATPAVSDEIATGQVLAAVPDDAGLYRAWLNPTSNQALRWIEEKLFAAVGVAGPRSKQAPQVVSSADAGSEQDLETRIDEAPLTDDRNAQAFAALDQRLSSTPLVAMLDVQSTRVAPDQVLDQVFVGSESALVLVARDPWDAAAVRAAFTQAAGLLWSNNSGASNTGAGWRAAANGIQELDGLGTLALSIDGRWLVVGNSAAQVRAIVGRRTRPTLPGAAYAAGWRHARELPDYERLTKLIDFPQIPPPPADAAPNETIAREPMFFSENIASLGRALQRAQSSEITVHDAGSLLRETVVYRIAP